MNQATKAYSRKGKVSFVAFSVDPGAGVEMSENNAQYTCREYREEMVLLGLRRRLEQEDLPEEEMQALRARLQELEAEMSLD